MATLTIRQLDNGLKDQLRVQAAYNQRSMEAEVRDILARTLRPQNNRSKGMGSAIHQLFKDENLELELPQRTFPKAAPDFS